MKKKNVLNLIKFYSEKNDSGFRNEAYEIARDFDNGGDYQLSEYIMALLSDANTFLPQTSENNSSYFRKIDPSNEPLPLPNEIKEDIVEALNAKVNNYIVKPFTPQILKEKISAILAVA